MAIVKLMVWNMEWLNDLFTDAHNLRALDSRPAHSPKDVTVGMRLKDLTGVIHDVDPDIIIVVEGPNTGSELEVFFSHVNGEWDTFIQRTHRAQQCNGIAVRTDTGKFHGDEALKTFSTPEMDAFRPFQLDVDDDDIDEMYRFERNPLYAEVKLTGGEVFRVLGLHLKSKGIYSAYEWSKWWAVADANRRKLRAQARRLKEDFINPYQSSPETEDIPLLVCGDINDGPGMDASEKRLAGSTIESLMGNVWFPKYTLGNALFDALSEKHQRSYRFEEISTTRFSDPIFNFTYHNVWIDHILYTRNRENWVQNARVIKQMSTGDYIWKAFPHASDHQPVVADIHL